MDGERVAVVGLGDLGFAVARRLHEVGVEVHGVDGDPERRRLWQEASRREALAATTELADRGIERAFVCVRMTDQAEAVLRDLAVLPAAAELPAYLLTTLEPTYARRLAERAGQPRAVETPISGGRGGAERGELTVLLGGGAAPGDAEFWLGTLAMRAFELPRHGDATVAKLLNNALAAYNAYAFARVVELAEAAGLDPQQCAELIRAGSGASWMAERFDDLVDELLPKDAALLAAELGSLPALDLADADEVLRALAHARALTQPRR